MFAFSFGCRSSQLGAASGNRRQPGSSGQNLSGEQEPDECQRKLRGPPLRSLQTTRPRTLSWLLLGCDVTGPATRAKHDGPAWYRPHNRNIYHWTARAPTDTNGIPVPPNDFNAMEGVAFVGRTSSPK